jgi:hypothetical protein
MYVMIISRGLVIACSAFYSVFMVLQVPKRQDEDWICTETMHALSSFQQIVNQVIRFLSPVTPGKLDILLFCMCMHTEYAIKKMEARQLNVLQKSIYT